MTRLRTMVILLAMMMKMLLLAAAARAEEFHVAVAGSDSGPGTAEQTFATIERARGAASPALRRAIMA